MAIQIPSAAGFIPNESVIDGLGKIMELFGPEAKARRAAALEGTKATTNATNQGARQTQVQTDYIPKNFDEGVRRADQAHGLDLRRVGMDEVIGQSAAGLNNARTAGMTKEADLLVPKFNEEKLGNERNYQLQLEQGQRADKGLQAQIDSNAANSQLDLKKFQHETQMDETKLRELTKQMPALLDLYRTLDLHPSDSSQGQKAEEVFGMILQNLDPKAAENFRRSKQEALKMKAANAEAEASRVLTSGKGNEQQEKGGWWTRPWTGDFQLGSPIMPGKSSLNPFKR